MANDNYKVVKFKRGLKGNLPSSGVEGQPYFTMDTGELYMGMGAGNPLVKIAKQTRVITFAYQDAKEGPFGPAIRFPFNGKIKSVSANCVTAGDADTVIGIDMITETKYKAELDDWISIFTTPITIPANKKFDSGEYNLAFYNITANSYFRINCQQYGNIKNLCIEVEVELQNI